MIILVTLQNNDLLFWDSVSDYTACTSADGILAPNYIRCVYWNFVKINTEITIKSLVYLFWLMFSTFASLLTFFYLMAAENKNVEVSSSTGHYV